MCTLRSYSTKEDIQNSKNYEKIQVGSIGTRFDSPKTPQPIFIAIIIIHNEERNSTLISSFIHYDF